MLRFAFAVFFGCAVSSCSSAVREAALNDDLPALKRAIAQARERGELDEGTVKGLADAVVRRELATSRGDVLVARVRELRTCVGPVSGPLDAVSERRDAGGGAATLALLEAGRRDGDELVALYHRDADPNWRAVAARAAVGDEHGALRRRFMVDPDLRVRRAALHAAFAEPRPLDRAALLEAARLDPDPLVRSIAVQTLGGIGGEDVVLALVDLWPRSDVATRQVIIDAWARGPSYRAGGEARLVVALEREGGLPALVAARALVQNESAHAAQASAVLVRAARGAAADEQKLALTWVTLDEPGLAALVQAMTKSDDESVRVLAAARLAGVAAHQKAAVTALRTLAKSERRAVRQGAESALVAASDKSVVEALRGALTVPEASERRHAALLLLDLGEVSDVALGLGDDVAAVRTQVACAVLARL